MRLWSIHPRYLDVKGMVALWREALLARHVLEGRTRGYRHHPQLQRFRTAADPVAAIHTYLAHVHAESTARGFRFDADKFDARAMHPPLPVTTGQLRYETEHLDRKLLLRDPARHAALMAVGQVHAHPLFTVVEGPVAGWEVIISPL